LWGGAIASFLGLSLPFLGGGEIGGFDGCRGRLQFVGGGGFGDGDFGLRVFG
jgi:hypothetical protein